MTEKKRRDYGSGSVYERSDGRWYGVIEAGWTERGTRRRITVSGKTEAAVKVRLRKKLAEIEANGITNVNAKATVKQWADEWLTIRERTQRPKSWLGDRTALRTWIIPTIGHRRFDQLAPADVRAVANAQRLKGLALSSQRRTHSVLIQLLKAAREEGYPVPDRVIGVKAPGKGVSDRTSLAPEQAVAMLAVAAKRPDASRWVAAFLEGLRQGEALGLTWDAIDFERDLITISWQLQALPYKVLRDRTSGFRVPDGYEAKQVRGRLHLVRPKTEAGWRVVPMVPWLKTSLVAWRDAAPDSKLGLVWPVDVGDPHKLDDSAWKDIQESAGVKHPAGRHYTIHEARHTTATLLLEAGVEPVIVAAILGQSRMLTDYIHVSRGPLAEALAKVAAALEIPAA